MVHSIHHQHFVFPKQESIFTCKSIAFLCLNILTLGIYGSAEALINADRVRVLKLAKKDLNQQAQAFSAQWDRLESDIKDVINNINNDETIDIDNDELIDNDESTDNDKTLEADTVFQKDIGDFSSEKDQFIARKNSLQVTTIQAKTNFKLNFLGVVSNTITFVGYLFANVMTLGVYGLYKNHALKNRVIILKAKNSHKKAYVDNQRLPRANRIELILNLFEESVIAKDTDPVKAYQALQKANDEASNLKKQNNDLQQEITALKTDEVKTKQAKTLEDELTALKNAQENQPEIIKLALQVGPIPSKCQHLNLTNQDLNGAYDIGANSQLPSDEINALKSKLTKNEVNFYEDYNKRYGSCRSAAEIVKIGFEHACDELFKLAQQNKVKLNNSYQTPSTLGIYAVYRYMALDIIMGGKIEGNGCHGQLLKINDNINMLPSQPEWVLQNKPDVAGGLKPVLELHYKQRDDFTPDENTLGLRDGVNGIEIRKILEELTDTEMNYLNIHLLDPVIENSHPDYQKMRTFMQNLNDPRVKLVLTASDLIQDVATAMQKKFSGSVLIPSLQDKFDEFDENVQPYVKPEDNQNGIKQSADDTLIQSKENDPVIEWQINLDVWNDTRIGESIARQQDFCDLLMDAKEKYQTVNQQILSGNLLKHKEKQQDKQIHQISWPRINQQYHVSHEMIGADFKGEGGERCLFSNLLAILLSDKKDLTSYNVQCLKNAMANYLENLTVLYDQWQIEIKKPANQQSNDALILKQKSDLCKSFSSSIYQAHHCSVAEYILWLRTNSSDVNIDQGDLTTLEIQLCAYTIGVRIGVLPINIDNASVKIDDIGRIIPEYEFYGPKTEEFLLMGNVDTGKGSYHGLFPKLSEESMNLIGDPQALKAALEVEDYWSSIDMNKIKD